MKHRRLTKRRWLLLGSAAGAALAVWLAAGSVLAFAGRWLDVGESPREADYALVLGGDENIRPFVAAALWRTGFVRRVLVSRTVNSPAVREGWELPVHEIIRRVLVVRGVPESAIVVFDTPAATTRGEAANLARYLERHPAATVLVVTSDFHTRRARWIVRKSLGRRAAQATMISAPTEAFRLDSWWRSQAGIRYVVNEYLRLAGYVVLYDRKFPYLAGAVVIVLAAAFIHRARRQLAAAKSTARDGPVELDPNRSEAHAGSASG